MFNLLKITIKQSLSLKDRLTTFMFPSNKIQQALVSNYIYKIENQVYYLFVSGLFTLKLRKKNSYY